MSAASPAAGLARSRSRVTPVVLGGIAIVLVVLALLGLPLIPIPAKDGSEHEFATFGTEFGRWRQYGGWRYTTDSWAYWAGFAACLFGGAAWWWRVRGYTKRYALIAVPAAVVLAVGPVVQKAIGLKTSDYASHVTIAANVGLNVGIIFGLLVVFYFATLLRRSMRSRVRARRRY